ncbi:hypothetical protein EPIR_2452 [Erwinia piriflorinigrans CFBP 5888]|uniref:Uncharacterized protein n=1 Tax=Erwinia piriflorinigrans CFBP 5888 TaxID=1161919 RepID=V5ZA57_9GAMM|nr:hypothetical protein EPIR_2452 [Erwinia piriflorinigrans CFBP 5888]
MVLMPGCSRWGEINAAVEKTGWSHEAPAGEH